MIPLSRFRLLVPDGPYEDRPLKSELLDADEPTGVHVNGYVLEAQYAWKDLFLLATSWDAPYEDAIEFTLLDAEFRVRSRRSFGRPYSSWSVYGHSVVRDGVVRFDCGRGSSVTAWVEHPWWKLGRPMVRLLVEPEEEVEEMS